MNKEQRNKIKDAVLISLYKCDNICFPVNIKYLVKCNSNCRLIPYSKHMKRHNLDYYEMLQHAETKDAYTVYNATNNKYLVFYNDIDAEIVTSYRYRWNIAHELGHVLLNHHKDNNKTKIFRNSLSKAEYRVLEDEADYFASYILVPHSVLYFAKPTSYYDVKDFCRISDAAAKIRFKEFSTWLRRKNKNEYDIQIVNLFYNYCYSRQCAICGHWLVNKLAIHCPICGNKLKWGVGKMIYDDGYKLDEKGRALICPNCGNEEIGEDTSYCKICGKYLINKCTKEEERDCFGNIEEKGCGRIAPGNARYCEYCGTKTTFYHNDFLRPWHEVKEDILARQQAAPAQEESNEGFYPLQDDGDSLPF